MQFRLTSPLQSRTVGSGLRLTYNYDTKGERTGITSLLTISGVPASGSTTSTPPRVAGRHLRQPGEGAMNFRAVGAIYKFEMARTWRTLLQSIVSPWFSTSLYFVVFVRRSARASPRSKVSAMALYRAGW